MIYVFQQFAEFPNQQVANIRVNKKYPWSDVPVSATSKQLSPRDQGGVYWRPGIMAVLWETRSTFDEQYNVIFPGRYPGNPDARWNPNIVKRQDDKWRALLATVELAEQNEEFMEVWRRVFVSGRGAEWVAPGPNAKAYNYDVKIDGVPLTIESREYTAQLNNPFIDKTVTTYEYPIKSLPPAYLPKFDANPELVFSRVGYQNDLKIEYRADSPESDLLKVNWVKNIGTADTPSFLDSPSLGKVVVTEENISDLIADKKFTGSNIFGEELRLNSLANSLVPSIPTVPHIVLPDKRSSREHEYWVIFQVRREQQTTGGIVTTNEIEFVRFVQLVFNQTYKQTRKLMTRLTGEAPVLLSEYNTPTDSAFDSITDINGTYEAGAGLIFTKVDSLATTGGSQWRIELKPDIENCNLQSPADDGPILSSDTPTRDQFYTSSRTDAFVPLHLVHNLRWRLSFGNDANQLTYYNSKKVGELIIFNNGALVEDDSGISPIVIDSREELVDLTRKIYANSPYPAKNNSPVFSYDTEPLILIDEDTGAEVEFDRPLSLPLSYIKDFPNSTADWSPTFNIDSPAEAGLGTISLVLDSPAGNNIRRIIIDNFSPKL